MMHNAGARLPFGLPRDVAILAAAEFIWGVGEGLFIFFYPLALQRWQIDPVQIGAVLSLLGVIMALVQIPAGYLSDRLGPLLLIRAALILGVIAAGLMAVATSLPVFVAGLIAYSATSWIAAPRNSYITQMRSNWSAQRGIAFVSACFLVGEIFGPMLGGRLAQGAGLVVVFRYAAGLFFLATVIAFFARRPAAQQEEAPAGASQPAGSLTHPRLIGLLGIVFITMLALSTPQQLSAIYLQDVRRLSLQQIGLTGAFAGIGGAGILLALGSVPPLVGMLAGQALLGLFCLLLWQGHSPAVFMIGYLCVGGSPLYRTMAAATVRTLVSVRDVGLAYGLVETGSALAIILAPLLAGLLYQRQPAAVYTVSLTALVVTMALTAGWYGFRKMR